MREDKDFKALAKLVDEICAPLYSGWIQEFQTKKIFAIRVSLRTRMLGFLVFEFNENLEEAGYSVFFCEGERPPQIPSQSAEINLQSWANQQQLVKLNEFYQPWPIVYPRPPHQIEAREILRIVANSYFAAHINEIKLSDCSSEIIRRLFIILTRDKSRFFSFDELFAALQNERDQTKWWHFNDKERTELRLKNFKERKDCYGLFSKRTDRVLQALVSKFERIK